jgi:hypothetical protein
MNLKKIILKKIVKDLIVIHLIKVLFTNIINNIE